MTQYVTEFPGYSTSLRSAASERAVEMELGMAEIHAGTAAGIDRTVFPVNGSTLAA